MTEQGYRRGRRGSARGTRSPGQDRWPGPGGFDPDVETDADLPPWAGLAASTSNRQARKDRADPVPARKAAEPEPAPGRAARRLRLGRAAALRRHRSRRRLMALLTVLAVAVVAGAAWHWLSGPSPAPSPFVRVLQPGEFRAVPDACRAVPPSTLGQYLPGQRKIIQPLAGPVTSECTFTVDSRPLFRVLDVTAQAYQPDLTVAGDGSATANAIAGYAQARQALAAPGRRAAAPPAVMTPIRRLGDSAVSGLQKFRLSGSAARVVIATVLVRERNVVIIVKLQGQIAANGSGAAPAPVLQAGALAAARELLAGVLAEHPVG